MLHCRIYRREGASEWVVLCHGVGGTSRIWFKQIRDFASRFNVMLVDLRGHGDSKGKLPDAPRYTPDLIAKDLVELLDHHGIPQAHFVGISLGSIVIHSLATHAPDRIRSAVLGGAITGFSLFAKTLKFIGDCIRSFVPYFWIYRIFAWILMPFAHHKESRDVFVKEARELGQVEFNRWYTFGKKARDVYLAMRERGARIPRLYISGSQDYTLLRILRKDVATDPDATMHVLEDCGHVCNIERPVDFNAETIRFVATHSM